MENFAEEDVLAVARAVVENPVEYCGGDYDPYFWCTYCDERTPDDLHYTHEDVVHALDCPVLIARDLLAGHEA